jgi:hypothetical protein
MNRRMAQSLDAVWWTSKLKIEKEIFTPEPPWKAYNPFDYYYRAEDLKQNTNKKSLPYRFLAVDSQNMEQVHDFCQQFGLLGPSAPKDDIVRLMFVDHFDSFEGPKEWRRPGDLIANASVEASLIERFGFNRAGYNDIEAMDIHRFRMAQTSMLKVINWDKQLKLRLEEDQANDTRLRLRMRVNMKLFRLMCPQLQWNEQDASWQMGWDIGSLEAAMYLMLLLDLLGPGKIVACPQCKLPFLTGRDWTKYCSPKCRNTFKQRGKRQKKRESSAQKGAKHGTKKRAR